jgi:hypothetical protein
MKLAWQHRPYDGTVPELPNEDWPRHDHEEEDETVAAAKIASGAFERVEEPEVQPVRVAVAARAADSGPGRAADDRGEDREAGPDKAEREPGPDKPDAGRGRPGPAR